MLLLYNTTRNLLDKYQGKKISLLAQLYYAAYSISTAGDASQQNCTLRNLPPWPEMKWWNLPPFKLIHTSHLWHDWFSFRTLKYGIVFLPSFFLFFSVVTANVYSLGLSENGKKLTCRRTTEMNTDEIWKRNFLSANQLLKAQVKHQSGKYVRSYAFRVLPLIGQLASLIKLLDSDTSLERVPCFPPSALGILHCVFPTCCW